MVTKKALSLGFLFFFTFSFFSCSSFFFYPSRELLKNPYIESFSYRDVFFSSKDGIKLHGWYVFAKTSKPKATVVLFHGNAENISTHVNAGLWLVKAGYDLFIFDYRGYGLSEGKPSLTGIHLDGISALHKALEIGRSDQLIVFGQSLGAAVSVYSVANFPFKDKIKLLILDSPFADYELILRDKLKETFILYPFSFLSGFLIDNTYSPLKWIEAIKPTPVVILHGRKDKIIPVRHSLLLAKKVNWEKLVIITNSDHILSLTEVKARSKVLKKIGEVLKDE